MPVLIGSYADHYSTFDDDGKPLGAPVQANAPSYVVVGPSGVRYAVGELDEGSVSAFTPDGELLNTLPTGGASPCHLALAGDFLLAANYGGGSVAVFALRPDGSLDRRTDLAQHVGGSVHPARQEAAHAHHVTVRDHMVHVVDLGMDSLVHYRLDPAGTLEHVRTTTAQPLGSGPRHLVFHPSGRVFVANELTSTVATYTSGFELLDVRPSVLVEPMGDNLPSELALSRDGRHLYVANRGNDTITTFAVEESGLLPVDEVSTGGTWPRHFAVLHGMLCVANQHSDTVTTLDLDPDSGVPHPARPFIEHPSPSVVVPL
ncbi:lactonase family protein [Dactylosporangium sp. AC04546]|uniref:lactonase family protein n=1 Tax=Dactylosporangium sp. AC04546 TaxID=2862460 RepID=UPI001EDCC4A4|nr:lactonase family protein [Dactylosporangium sp. AC04546]WVK84379.1 lactonase family protein [Dactylosporangium sp. AC04546]